MNLFTIRVKLFFVSSSELSISLCYILEVLCILFSDQNNPSNCLKSFYFPYRSKLSVYRIDEEEKWHTAPHSCVLSHFHTLYYRPALCNEASESTCDMEKRWVGRAPNGDWDAETIVWQTGKFCQLKFFCSMLHNLFDRCVTQISKCSLCSIHGLWISRNYSKRVHNQEKLE